MIRFADGHWIHVDGSGAPIDEDGDTINLGLGVRNAGTGIVVLQGWCVWPQLVRSDVDHRPAEEFRRHPPGPLRRSVGRRAQCSVRGGPPEHSGHRDELQRIWLGLTRSHLFPPAR
jgi:hypothetical protein